MALPPGAPDPLQKPLHERCSLNQPFWGVVTLEEFKTVPTHQHFRRVYLHEGPNGVVGISAHVWPNDHGGYTEKIYLALEDGTLGEQMATHVYPEPVPANIAGNWLTVEEPDGRRFLAFPPGF